MWVQLEPQNRFCHFIRCTSARQTNEHADVPGRCMFMNITESTEAMACTLHNLLANLPAGIWATGIEAVCTRIRILTFVAVFSCTADYDTSLWRTRRHEVETLNEQNSFEYGYSYCLV